MTPFQELRLWARRASTGSRTSAALSVAIVVGLLAWALVPAGDHGAAENLSAGGAVTARTLAAKRGRFP